ncbi:haloacid dehalogenase type II [Haloferax sp. DFSO60]|uniref:haloacid dehalogenase type II n=1 Tax=Haloferax sp. DFSO60 TaxID=3388652 RepID=UPI00397E3E8A
MAFDPTRVSTVTFDSYSTLVDVDAAEKALAEHVSDPEPVSKLWRARSLEYTFVGNHIDDYRPFYEVNRAALQYALNASDVSVSESDRDGILSVYHELDVFDDVRDSIERLQSAGYGCYVVSNGNPEMLDSMVEHADIGSLLDGVISADEVETFKPDVELYRHAAARTGTPIDEIAHATAAWFDVMGAQHAGMQGVWVDRKSSPWEPFGPEPDVTVPNLTELVDQLGV